MFTNAIYMDTDIIKLRRFIFQEFFRHSSRKLIVMDKDEVKKGTYDVQVEDPLGHIAVGNIASGRSYVAAGKF
jgi:hypothetical protein